MVMHENDDGYLATLIVLRVLHEKDWKTLETTPKPWFFFSNFDD